MSASCRGMLGCTWPVEYFGNCRCLTEKNFVPDRNGNCVCKKNYALSNDSEYCIPLFPQAAPGNYWIWILIFSLLGVVAVFAVVWLRVRNRKNNVGRLHEREEIRF